ncbi:hypothetical protein PIB30_026913 [Stylosanthes scabra]|uniref:Uncharacterized protein n=1 Tax=Stylosanthes scabra TaxID=79078 RepID=A0ABU6WAP0_9FABA|nr:hypothetical protein [Stylosanthes scabra]
MPLHDGLILTYYSPPSVVDILGLELDSPGHSPFRWVRRGASNLPGHHFGTSPSWEYQPMQSGFGSSSTHLVHDQHPPHAPPHHQVIRPRPRRPRQPPPCSTSSHLQHSPSQ